MFGSPVVKDLKTKTAHLLTVKSDYMSSKRCADKLQVKLAADLHKAKKALEKNAKKVDKDGWNGCQCFNCRWAKADELHGIAVAKKEVDTMLNVVHGFDGEVNDISKQVLADIAKETAAVMTAPFM